jgi:hypothetical protein
VKVIFHRASFFCASHPSEVPKSETDRPNQAESLRNKPSEGSTQNSPLELGSSPRLQKRQLVPSNAVAHASIVLALQVPDGSKNHEHYAADKEAGDQA